MEEFVPADASQFVGQCLVAGPHAEYAFEQLARKLNVAADRPHILDAHLPSLAAPVLAALQAEDPSGLERGGRVFCILCKVRGVAPVAKLLPHEMPWVGRVASLLGERKWGWETTYVLLVWLGELVVMPIELRRLVADVGALVELGKTHLMAPGKPSAAAAAMLARLLTRPDCGEHLAPFLDWCLGAMSGGDADLALLEVTASILQTGSRDMLLPLARQLFERLSKLSGGDASVLRRKLTLKVTQRLGLVYLAPRLAAWRYQRGSRLLMTGLAATAPLLAQPVLAPEEIAAASAAAMEARRETWPVPLDVDRVVHLLLQGLKDRDTIVRWTAAKGIGRTTERLPADFADEVVEAVMELCNPAEEESAWHGSCLAVAELARRGLLVPEALGRALPAVLEALRYDVKQSARTVGSQVRDAACYVMWASARAYAPAVLAPFVVTIAGALLECAALDREINCRRAASAAIQEHVGRVGLMPRGLELVGITDYFQLGSLRSSYLEVAPAIAAFAEYGPWFVETVVERKLGHWDAQVREHAALLLGQMAALDACRDDVAAAMPRLRLRCVDATSPETRHGALLAIAHAVGPQHTSGEAVRDVATIVPELEAARLFRGKGGEMVRVAACVLVEGLAKARVPLVLDVARLTPHLSGRPDSGKTGAKRHKEFLDECLRNASEALQGAAASALRHFCEAYLTGLESKVRAAIVGAYCAHLTVTPAQDQVASFTRGAALALGSLPDALFDETSLALSQRVLADAVTLSCDAETRKLCVTAMRVACPETVEAVLAALRDYSIDERGDVGSWARAAACAKLPSFLGACCTVPVCERACAALGEIAAGRMEQLRGQAVETMKQVAVLCTWKELLDVVADVEADGTWLLCCRLLVLSVPNIRRSTFLGLCVSGGLRTPDVAARETLIRFLCDKKRGGTSVCDVLWREDIPALLQQYARDDRVAVHLLACLDALVRNGCFDAAIDDATSADTVRGHCWNVFVNSSSMQLLCSGIDLMCALLRFAHASVSPLVVLLGHRYPRVRQHACLQLQLQLCAVDVLCPDAAMRDQIVGLLIQGASQDADVCVEAQVRELFKL